MGESVDSTIQQQTSQQASLLESSCLASGVSHEYSGKFTEEVVNQIKEPYGYSSRRICESIGLFLEVVGRELGIYFRPTIPDGANFLNY